MTMSHERLDVYVAAREALVQGHALVSRLTKGYGHFGGQLKRALLSTFLNVTEAANRSGADRSMRCHIARAEAAEASAAIEGLGILQLVDVEQGSRIRHLLERIYAMLTKLASLGS